MKIQVLSDIHLKIRMKKNCWKKYLKYFNGIILNKYNNNKINMNNFYLHKNVFFKSCYIFIFLGFTIII